MQDWIENVRNLFRYYKSLGDKSFAQVSDEQLNWKPNEASNSLAVIAKHMAGNMLSRWTDFRSSDGEKEWRNRESEFENDLTSREAIIDYWEKGWTTLFDALAPITDDDLNEIVYIRNQGHTIAEAINRQLGHYAYHVGQIVYLARLIQDEKWESLSIPKGKSEEYNAKKFNAAKAQQHFTEEFLDDDKS